jgi:hypothetical protein
MPGQVAVTDYSPKECDVCAKPLYVPTSLAPRPTYPALLRGSGKGQLIRVVCR